MTKHKEKHIVKQIVNNWDKYFPDLKFYKTEWSFRNFRVDIAAGFDIDLQEIGKSDVPRGCHVPVLFEVKYNSEARDLLFEMQKQLEFANYYNKNNMCVICVISDEFDISMQKFLIDNDILMFKISMIDDDIETLELEDFESTLILQKESEEVL